MVSNESFDIVNYDAIHSLHFPESYFAKHFKKFQWLTHTLNSTVCFEPFVLKRLAIFLCLRIKLRGKCFTKFWQCWRVYVYSFFKSIQLFFNILISVCVFAYDILSTKLLNLFFELISTRSKLYTDLKLCKTCTINELFSMAIRNFQPLPFLGPGRTIKHCLSNTWNLFVKNNDSILSNIAKQCSQNLFIKHLKLAWWHVKTMFDH